MTRSRASRGRSCDDGDARRRCTDRSRRRRAGSRDRRAASTASSASRRVRIAARQAPRDPRHQHRRNVAHRAGGLTVIDTGWHKVARYDPERGIDTLDLERIVRRAPISGPGARRGSAPAAPGGCGTARDGCVRIVSPTSPASISPRRCSTCSRGAAIPTIPGSRRRRAPRSLRLGAAAASRRRRRSDGDGPPPSRRSAAAAALAAASASRPHPDRRRRRREAARACALLAERHFMPARHEATTCDLLAAIDRWHDVPPHIQPARVSSRSWRARQAAAFQTAAERAARAGRVAMTRRCGGRFSRAMPIAWRGGARPGSPRVVLASGHGAVIAPESGVREGELLVALDVQAATTRECAAGREVTEARIRIASLVDRAWLTRRRVASCTVRRRFRPREGGAARDV